MEIPDITYAQTIATNKYIPVKAENYERICGKYKECCEILPNDRPIKLYFDIDFKGILGDGDDDLPPIGEPYELEYEPDIKQIALDVIKRFCEQKVGVTPEFVISSASSERFICYRKHIPKWCLSLRIVVNNVVALKSVQNQNIKKFNEFAKKYTRLPNLTQNNLFDEGVYDSNRKMRSVNCTKPGENRYLELEEGTFEQSVISSFIPENAVVYHEEIEVAAAPTAAAPTAPPTDYDYKKVDDFIDAGIFDKIAAEYNGWIQMGFALFNAFGDAAGWVLFDKFSRRCPKYGRVQDDNRAWWDKMAASVQPENKLTIKSIFKWARDEDKDEYNRINDKYKKQKKDEEKQKKGQTKDEERKKNDAKAISVGVWNDTEAADKIIKLYKHWVSCDGVLYVFDETTGLWSNTESVYFKILNKFEKDLRLLKEGKDGITVTNKGYGNTTNLMRQLLPQISSKTINNDWLKQNETSSLGYLLFNNGYLDCKQGLFYDKFTPEIVFIYKINHNFTAFNEEDMAYMEDIKRRFFTLPLGEKMADYFMLQIACAISGEVLKRIVFGLGSTNCGKSVITKALASAFGDYVGSFNAENLAYSKSSADEAAQMRWVKLLRYKRLVYSNEMRSSVELNGNMIKKISSGGDSLIARGHCANEEAFIPQFMAFCMANDMNKITPYDDALQTRIRVISFEKQFVDEPKNEFELKKDIAIENEIQTARFQRAFVGMIIQRYLDFVKGGRKMNEPEEVIRARKEWIGEENEGGLIGKFLEDFEITNSPDDFVASIDINDWLKRSGTGISMRKFGVDFKKLCAIKKYNNIENKVKKVSGKGIQVWVGVREIIDESYTDIDAATEKNS